MSRPKCKKTSCPLSSSKKQNRQKSCRIHQFSIEKEWLKELEDTSSTDEAEKDKLQQVLHEIAGEQT